MVQGGVWLGRSLIAQNVSKKSIFKEIFEGNFSEVVAESRHCSEGINSTPCYMRKGTGSTCKLLIYFLSFFLFAIVKGENISINRFSGCSPEWRNGRRLINFNLYCIELSKFPRHLHTSRNAFILDSLY